MLEVLRPAATGAEKAQVLPAFRRSRRRECHRRPGFARAAPLGSCRENRRREYELGARRVEDLHAVPAGWPTSSRRACRPVNGPSPCMSPPHAQRCEVDRHEAELLDHRTEATLGVGVVAGVEEDAAARRVIGSAAILRSVEVVEGLDDAVFGREGRHHLAAARWLLPSTRIRPGRGGKAASASGTRVQFRPGRRSRPLRPGRGIRRRRSGRARRPGPSGPAVAEDDVVTGLEVVDGSRSRGRGVSFRRSSSGGVERDVAPSVIRATACSCGCLARAVEGA